MRKIMKIILLVIAIGSMTYFTSKAQVGYSKFGLEIRTKFDVEPTWLTIDESPDNIWQIGKSHKTVLDSIWPWESGRDIMTDTLVPYPPNNISSFSINVELIYEELCWNRFFIRFEHKYDTDTLCDGGYIEISYDNGNTWYNAVHSPCFDQSGEGNKIYTELDTIKGGIPAFSGKSNGWVQSDIDLFYEKKPEMSKNRSAIVRWVFKSDSIDNNKDGWLIDNIFIRVVNGCNVSIQSQEIVQILKIYPNPIKESSIAIIPDDLTHGTYAIINLLGQTIQTGRISGQRELILNKSDFKPDMYTIRLMDDKKQSFYKGRFIVN